jgi:hypothetical protein
LLRYNSPTQPLSCIISVICIKIAKFDSTD